MAKHSSLCMLIISLGAKDTATTYSILNAVSHSVQALIKKICFLFSVIILQNCCSFSQDVISRVRRRDVFPIFWHWKKKRFVNMLFLFLRIPRK